MMVHAHLVCLSDVYLLFVYRLLFEVVDEFLVDKDKVPQQQRLIWKRPKMFKLVVGSLSFIGFQ